MKFRFAWSEAVVLALACGACVAQVPPLQPAAAPPAIAQPPTTQDPEAGNYLAERFCETGLELASKAQYSVAGLRQSAVLLDAACKLNPNEPRFLRLMAFWRAQIGDSAGAIKAWQQYRALLPDDIVAQCEVIDLYLTRLEANDAKIKYIRDLLQKPTLDNTVKAHIAAKAVTLLDQRSRSEALAMLAQAKQFYLLPELARMEWEMLPADATAVQRMAALLDIVRANPGNANAVGEVADLLSANGVSDKALIWYGIFVDINAINDRPTDESFTLNYLAERFRAGQTAVANDQLDRILQRYPDDPRAWFLRLTTQRSQESPQMLDQARGVFAHWLADLCDRIQKAPVGGEVAAAHRKPATTAPAAGGDAAPTSQPDQSAESALPPPDLDKSVARVKQLDPKVESVLIVTLVEQAWFEVYYDHNAALALPAIETLKKLGQADSVAMKRLQGWYAIASGDEAGARALLGPQKDQDALSALGLFELESKKNNAAQVAALGSKLLAFPQTGELAAVIFQATKAHGVKGSPATADSAALKAEVDKFPADFLEVIHSPQRFYTLTTVIAPAHPLGDPMIAEITLANVGKFDITIGPEGLLRPVYTFDAELQGLDKQLFPVVLQDRIMGRLVLHPGESITQQVRIDQGDLSASLHKFPAVQLFVQPAVVTNAPPTRANGRPQAGGMFVPFDRKFARSARALALAPARQAVFADLLNGPQIKDRILDLDLISVYYKQYVQPKANNAELAAAGDFLSALDRSRSDPDANVRAWAAYQYALVSSGMETTKDIVEMIQTPTWQSQLLGLVAMQTVLPRDTAIEWAAKAATAANDPLVKGYAASLVTTLSQQPATQPAKTAADAAAADPKS